MREKIIEILNEICPGNDFENETAIIDDGIIDSLLPPECQKKAEASDKSDKADKAD